MSTTTAKRHRWSPSELRAQTDRYCRRRDLLANILATRVGIYPGEAEGRLIVAAGRLFKPAGAFPPGILLTDLTIPQVQRLAQLIRGGAKFERKATHG